MQYRRLLFSLAAFVSTLSAAQETFSGLHVQLSTGYQHDALPSVTGLQNGTPIAPISSTDGERTPFYIGTSYYWPLSGNWLIGLGAELAPESSPQPQTNDADFQGFSRQSIRYRLSNQFSLFASPSYAFASDKLLYFKIGYAQESVSAQAYGTGFANGTQVLSGLLSGYMLGLGYRQKLVGHLYVFGEINTYSYDSINSDGHFVSKYGYYREQMFGVGNTPYNVLFGLGYKF